MQIEIPINTIIIIDGVKVKCVESKRCSDCYVKKSTEFNMTTGQCGTRKNWNVSPFVCNKDRSDKKNTIFKKI